MDADLKAQELFDKFQQYTWHEIDGYVSDDTLTKKEVQKVIDEIELQADNWGVTSVRAYWREVRRVLISL
jgi:hypothetical protein